MKSATLGANSVAYAYDALGRRVRRTQGTQITKFTYDGLDVVMDDVNGTLTKYQNGFGIDNKLKMATGNTPSYFLTDHLGSTNALTNSTGAITSSATYDSFGNQTGNLATRYSYTGREFDSFTGLHFYRARWYDANIGRFISEDPIGFRGGDINLYGYVENDPINMTDPTGLIGLYTYPNGRLRGSPFPFGDFYPMYDEMHRNRGAGLERFPGEENSAMRHCVVSCEDSGRWGYDNVRLMGFGNEGQGFFLDIQRWWNGRPIGAFQLDDLSNNERGFNCQQSILAGCATNCVQCCEKGMR